MDDLQKYINERMERDPEFADGYYEGYESFKVGVLLKQARESAGVTQAEMARKLSTRRDIIVKAENQPDEVRLVVLKQYAEALGKNISLFVS